MIFYGTKGSQIHSERKGGIKCDSCNEITTHNIHVYGRYGYLYWIPIFPMSKKGVSECSHCKAILEFKEMNKKLQRAYVEVKRNSKTPIWYWSGLGIILGIMAYGFYSSTQHDKDIVNYIKEPIAGDVIEFVNTENGYFSTLKVSAVTNDSIFVIQNDYETDKKGSVLDLDTSKNYTTKPFSIGRDQVQQYFDEKIFYDINR